MKPVFCLLALALIAPSVVMAQPADWCWDQDDIRAYYQDGLITVIHNATVYNCCPDSFTFQVEQEGAVIRVWEHENLTEACLCLCCYNLSVSLGAPAPGDYTIEFSWSDYETYSWPVVTLPIHVPEGTPPARIDIVETYASPCLETQDVPEPDPDSAESTWGGIKRLFE